MSGTSKIVVHNHLWYQQNSSQIHLWSGKSPNFSWCLPLTTIDSLHSADGRQVIYLLFGYAMRLWNSLEASQFLLTARSQEITGRISKISSVVWWGMGQQSVVVMGGFTWLWEAMGWSACDNGTEMGWGVLTLCALISLSGIFLMLKKYLLDLLKQLSYSDTCWIWMWYSISNQTDW